MILDSADNPNRIRLLFLVAFTAFSTVLILLTGNAHAGLFGPDKADVVEKLSCNGDVSRILGDNKESFLAEIADHSGLIKAMRQNRCSDAKMPKSDLFNRYLNGNVLGNIGLIDKLKLRKLENEGYEKAMFMIQRSGGNRGPSCQEVDNVSAVLVRAYCGI